MSKWIRSNKMECATYSGGRGWWHGISSRCRERLWGEKWWRWSWSGSRPASRARSRAIRSDSRPSHRLLSLSSSLWFPTIYLSTKFWSSDRVLQAIMMNKTIHNIKKVLLCTSMRYYKWRYEIGPVFRLGEVVRNGNGNGLRWSVLVVVESRWWWCQ